MKLKSRLVLALLPGVLLAACGEASEDHLAGARSAFAAEDFPTARRQAIAGLGEDAGNRDLLHILVRSLLRMHDPEGAESAVGRLKRQGAKGPEIRRYEAEIMILRGRTKDALAALTGDSSADAWRLRAAAMLYDGDTDTALSMFQKGMAAGPDARLVADYAQFLIDGSELAGARKAIARLERLAPDGYRTMMLTGRLAERKADYAAALAAYRKAAKRLPGRFEPLLAQASILDMTGKIGEAGKMVDKAAALAPGAPEVRSMRLQLLSEKGEWAKIRQMLQQVDWSLDPRSADGMTYGEALLNLGHPEQARAMFQRTVLLSPENRYAQLMLARSQLASGDPDEAYYTMEPLLEGVLVAPEEVELALQAAQAAGWSDDAATLKARLASPVFKRQVALARQAEGASMTGNWEKAREAYRALLDTASDPEILKRLAFACSKSGANAEAIAYADRALAANPDDISLVYIAGKVRLNARTDLARAAQYFEKALAEEPRNLSFRAALQQARAGGG